MHCQRDDGAWLGQDREKNKGMIQLVMGSSTHSSITKYSVQVPSLLMQYLQQHVCAVSPGPDQSHQTGRRGQGHTSG